METLDPFLNNFIPGYITLPETLVFFLYLIFIGGFIFIQGLVSGSETSFLSISQNQASNIQKNKNFRSRKTIQYLKRIDHFVATQIVINFFLIVVLIILSNSFINRYIQLPYSDTIRFLIVASIIGSIILVFGYLIPNYFAIKKPVKYSRLAVLPLTILYPIFSPLGSLLNSSQSFIAARIAKKKQNITIDDLTNALNLTTEQITEDENILKGIVKFGNIDTKEIMKSRVDVTAVEYQTNFKSLIETITESGHSRIPVFEDSFDNIKGILYIKDLLPHIKKNANFKWQKLIREPYFVPENKKINDLLKEFQSNKIHMAFVIDEYGGTNGIVTLEDILEEIVGEITDESDTDEANYKRINENTYVFEGKTLLNDFFKIVNIEDGYFNDIKGDADTIAGLILELIGELPSQKQVIKYKNIIFQIISVDKRRIKRIKVTINNRQEDE